MRDYVIYSAKVLAEKIVHISSNKNSTPKINIDSYTINESNTECLQYSNQEPTCINTKSIVKLTCSLYHYKILINLHKLTQQSTIQKNI